MKKFLALFVVFIFTFGCIPDTGPDERANGGEVSLNNFLIIETGEAKFPYTFIHKNSERIYLRDLDENGITDGFFYKNGAYEEYIELDELTGLIKSRRNNEGLTVLYSFKENNRILDLAIQNNGETYFVTNQNVSIHLNNKANKIVLSKTTTAEYIRNSVSQLELAIEAINCAGSLAILGVGTVGSVGVGAIPLGWIAAFNCTSFISEITQSVLEKTDSELNQEIADGLDQVNDFVDVLTCPFDIAGCTAFIAGEALDLQAKLDELKLKFEELQKELEEIQKLSAELVILGNLNFGEVALNETVTQTLEIFNRGNEPVTITNLEINSHIEQFNINTTFPLTLGPIDSETFSSEISISFVPKTTSGSFNSFLKIINDKYTPYDVKAITATATNENEAKIRFSGTLNFNGVAINEPHSVFFDIENPNLNENLEIQSIAFDFGDLPTDKFSINGWTNGIIEPGKKQEIEVVFVPNDDLEYDGLVIVNNNLDDVNNKWPVFGKGNKLEIRLVEELDFGQVALGESRTLSLDIENPNLNDPITVTDIELLEGFSVDWQAGTIAPLSKKTVNVTFSPVEDKEYTSLLIVVNDIDQENNRVSLKGNQDEENYLSGIWKLQLTDSSTDRVILNELITFNTDENKINTELGDGGIYIENNFQFNDGLDINLVVQNNISDACEDGSAPFQSTQLVTLNISTKWVFPLRSYRIGEYSLILNMNPNVPCPENYPSSAGEATLIRQ